MPFVRPSLTALQTQALADVAAALPTGTPLRSSVLRIMALAQAAFAHGHYGYLDWIAREGIPFTATGERLEAWAALKGVTRTLATAATGGVALSGTVGAGVPAGTLVTRGDGVRYATDAAGSIGIGGTTVFAVTAVAEGSAGNADNLTTLSLANPIAGVNGSVVAFGDITGGTDDEDDDGLRTRMLQKYAAPPQGGAESDYVAWALQVPGVTRAWARPNGAGDGSVVLYTMLDVAQQGAGGFPQGADGGATAETRTAAATGDQLAVANHVFPLRPATALVHSCAPVAQNVAVTIAGLSPDTTAIRDAIELAIEDAFRQVGTPLGGTVHQSDISDAITSVEGADRFTLTAPSAPVATAVGSLPVLGALTVS